MISMKVPAPSNPVSTEYRYDFAVKLQSGRKTIRVFAPDLYTASRSCIDRWQATVDSSTPTEPTRPYIILVSTNDPSIIVAPPNSNVVPFPIKPPIKSPVK